ncbi:MAG: hypothetical protein ACOVSS_06465 [Bacteroidia bacterium]|jgi:hypothetical protein
MRLSNNVEIPLPHRVVAVLLRFPLMQFVGRFPRIFQTGTSFKRMIAMGLLTLIAIADAAPPFAAAVHEQLAASGTELPGTQKQAAEWLDAAEDSDETMLEVQSPVHISGFCGGMFRPLQITAVSLPDLGQESPPPRFSV